MSQTHFLVLLIIFQLGHINMCHPLLIATNVNISIKKLKCVGLKNKFGQWDMKNKNFCNKNKTSY